MIPALFLLFAVLASPAFCTPDSSAESTTNGFCAGIKWMASLPGRGAIGFYRSFISGQDLPTCNFEPSCSAFSLNAYKSTDPVQATLIMFDRLTRCNYWIYGEYPHEHGRFIDPVEHHMLWGRVNTAGHHFPAGQFLSALNVLKKDDASSPRAALHDLAFADAMAAAGETELALEEYARLPGGDIPRALRIEALFHAGWMLYETGRYADAAAVFGEIPALTDSSSAEAHDASLFVQLAQMETGHEETEQSSQHTDLFSYIHVWSRLQTGDIDDARHLLTDLLQSPDTAVREASAALAAVLDSLDSPLDKKGWIAGVCSALVPGSGRLYTGRYGDAVFSSIATGGTAGLAVRALRSGPWTKAAGFTGAAAGFYAGNIYGSIISARTENARSRTALRETVRSAAESRGILPEQLVAKQYAHRLPEKGVDAQRQPDIVLSCQALYNADQSYSAKQWHKAIRSYRRFIFFNPHEKTPDSVLFRLGKALEHTGEHEKARQAYETLLDNHPGSEYEDRVRLILARIHLRDGRSDLSAFELDEEIAFGRDTRSVETAEYLKSWVFLQESDFNGARNWLKKQREPESHDLSEAQSILTAKLSKQRGMSYKSPRIARGLSMVVPGLGQAYAGKPLDGVNALLLNGAIIYAMVQSAESENWLDLGLITGLLFHRYYFGNIYNAERYSREHNERQNTRLIRELRDKVRTIGISFDPFAIKEKH